VVPRVLDVLYALYLRLSCTTECRLPHRWLDADVAGDGQRYVELGGIHYGSGVERILVIVGDDRAVGMRLPTAASTGRARDLGGGWSRDDLPDAGGEATSMKRRARYEDVAHLSAAAVSSGSA
jgi:hypothetical protein